MSEISKTLAIPGWLAERELPWLAEQAVVANQIVEVSSHLGRSTRAMADTTKGKMVAVDDWYGPRDTAILHSDRTSGRLTSNSEKNFWIHQWRRTRVCWRGR